MSETKNALTPADQWGEKADWVEAEDGTIVCLSPEDAFEESRALWPQRRRLIAAAPALLEALDDLLAFHDHTHPRHSALLEDYHEACVAAEFPAKSSDLLDDLMRAASTAIASARGEG
ncbi:hypothetical protein [Rhodovarius lipocyclicus]|uniref:hypothetical protein n=1 Tax=Rhodovarius lipocyclicus TaxID=268410 RepID=UPI0013576F1F|nr:hypothetical protein [Rhodovarius lipocyclicus]